MEIRNLWTRVCPTDGSRIDLGLADTLIEMTVLEKWSDLPAVPMADFKRLMDVGRRSLDGVGVDPSTFLWITKVLSCVPDDSLPVTMAQMVSARVNGIIM